MRRLVCCMAAFVLLLGFGMPGWSFAGELAYPTRQITYMVTFDPGGQSDVEARRQQPLLERSLGQRVVITYKPGGGGALGWAEMVRGRPDGYVITGINLPQISILPLLQDVGFQTDQILPVALFHRTPMLVVVRKDSPFKTVKEFIEAAKKNPGKIKMAATGTNGLGHVAAMRIGKLAGITTEYVPFTGNAPLMTALIGGHVDVAITVSSDAVAYQDQAIPLGIASEKRIDILPAVPTLKEQGVDFSEASYRGVAVPVGTPDPIVRKLEKVFLETVCNNAEYVAMQKKGGYEPIAMGVEEAKALIARGTATYQGVFAEMGILKK